MILFIFCPHLGKEEFILTTKFLSKVDLKDGSMINGQEIARLADIPTQLPADGGDSATVGGIAPEQILRSDVLDTQQGGIKFLNSINLNGSVPTAMDLDGSVYYDATAKDFKGKVDGGWRKLWTDLNFNPANKLDATAKAVDSDKFDGLDSTQFVRSDARSVVTNILNVNTNSGANPFYVSRLGSETIEFTKWYVDDAYTYFHYKNDEFRSGFKWIVENTDTEASDGSRATTGTLEFYKSNTDVFLSVDSKRVWHEGTFNPNSKADKSLILTAGAGLTGGGDLSVGRTFAIDYAGTGSATTASRSDHNHDTTYFKLAGGTVTGATTFSSTLLVNNANANILRLVRSGATNANIEIGHTGATRYFGINSTGEFVFGDVVDLNASGKIVYHSGNFTPSSKADLAGATFTGGVIVPNMAVNGGLSVNNGADLTLKAGSTNVNDAGDIVFANNSGAEMLRLWYNGGTSVNVRFGSADTAKQLFHSGNFDPSTKADATTTSNHISNTSNPHGVTKAQVGLGSVLDYGVATQTEAEAGTSDSKYMTPLKTSQAISKLQAVKSVAGKTGIVTLAKSDVGLTNVEDKSSATIRSEITSSNVTTALGFTPENNANKGIANGYAGLGADGKIPLSQIPDTARQQTYVVADIAGRDALTGLITGDKVFVTTGSESYIWNGSTWVLMADADWANVNLDWANITNKPTSTTAQIDSAVTNSHTHSNKSVLDAITTAPEPAFTTLPVSKGGTGAGSFTATRVLYGNGTSALGNDANFVYASSKLSVPYITATGTTRTAGAFYAGTTAPSSTNRLNYDGGLYATELYEGSTRVALAGHVHDDRYYTESELNTSGGGGAVHWNNITNKPALSVDGHTHDTIYYTKTNMQTSGQASMHWNNLTNVPTAFPASGGNADTLDNLHATSFVRSDADNTAPISFNDVSRYWLSTASTWGIYWNTTDNQLEFRGADTKRFHVDLDDGNTWVGGNLYMNSSSIHGIAYLHGGYGMMMRSTDEWLRINDDSSHSAGVYFGSSQVRTDGYFNVGGNSDLQLRPTGITLKNKFTIQYNSADDSLDFVYA